MSTLGSSLMWACKDMMKRSGYLLDTDDNNKKPTNTKRRYLLWISLLIAGTLIYFILSGSLHTQYLIRQHEEVIPVQVNADPSHQLDSAFVVDNSGCRIPAMDPFDLLILQYIIKEPAFDCAKNYPQPLIGSNLTALFLVQSALADYNISDAALLECCYRPFWRVDGNISNYDGRVDGKIAYAKNCTYFKYEVNIQEEFVKIECNIGEHKIYADYFAFCPLKPKVEEIILEKRKKRFNGLIQDEESLSVLVIGIDTVSRLNFHRQMPRTEAFLREMDSIEMLGYNKVADNTFPNLIPVLTGLTEEELQKSCWPTPKTSLDSCSFLWNNFSDAGYITALGEDAPPMGTFNLHKVGFVLPPTDYYMRPYSVTYEGAFGHTIHKDTKLCIRSRKTVEVLLEYASKFAYTMESKRSFGFFWEASLTHDFLNYPRLGDELVETVLRDMLTNSSALNNTVLVFMSDHGIRSGAIRETYQGQLEERLPLLIFIFPRWFREKYSEAIVNLRRNTRRLTTPFDLHFTLAEFMDLSQLSKSSLQSRTRSLESLSPRPRGSSLFLPVNNTRTCEDAGILPHWCTCQQSQPLGKDTEVVQKMSQFLINYLNHLLLAHPQCSRLELLSVHDARLQTPVEHIRNHTAADHVKDYVLIVETRPGNGMFEATIRQRTADMVNMAGPVSRINTYGQQSACVDDYHMKLYCFCA